MAGSVTMFSYLPHLLIDKSHNNDLSMHLQYIVDRTGGLDLDIENHSGDTALTLACRSGDSMAM